MSFTESLDAVIAANSNGLLSAHPTWQRVSLGRIATILNGFPFESKRFKAAGFPLIRIRDVMRGQTETSYEGRFDPAYVVQSGDLLIGMDGDFNCALWRGPSALLNQRVCKLTSHDRFYDLRFLLYALPGYLEAINRHTSAITVKHLSSRTIADIPLPLPPRAEQRRLVERIESFITRLDDAVATLERVQRNLTRYRASVLKAAVEGRLVPSEAEVARSEGRSYEPASVLLKRILAEHRRRSEGAELAKLKVGGTGTGGGKGKDRYCEPTPPDDLEGAELPEGWCWASIEQLSEVSGGITKNSRRDELPIQLPYLRVANVYADELRLDDVTRIGVSKAEADRAALQKGDLLVVEGNGSIEQIGRVAIWDGSISPCLHQNHLIRVRFPIVALAEWTLAWLLSPSGRYAIEQVVSSTSGLHTLSLSKVERLRVPLPPLAEQVRIKQEIDRLTTVQQATLREAVSQTTRCQRLRQSILKWAFAGQLVEQDQSDEPAFVLLQRIKAERAITETAGNPRARSPKRSRAKAARSA